MHANTLSAPGRAQGPRGAALGRGPPPGVPWSPALRPLPGRPSCEPATMLGIPRAPLLRLQLALLVAAGAGARVSAPRSLAWGPGLQAAVVLPVRYFFLQAVDSDGRNLTSSPPGQCPSPSPRVPGPIHGHFPL